MKQKRLHLAEEEVLIIAEWEHAHIDQQTLELTNIKQESPGSNEYNNFLTSFLQYMYFMSKLAGKDGQHIREKFPVIPMKPIATGRPVITQSARICEDRNDCDQDELSEQIANSRSRVSPCL